MTPVEYMYLLFARESYHHVTDGNVSVRVPEPKDSLGDPLWGYFTREAWPALQQEANAEHARWEADVRRFRKGSRYEVVERKTGSFGNRATQNVAIVTLPDGRTLECDPARASSRIDEESRKKAGPEPTSDKAQAFERWKSRTGYKHEEMRGWVALDYRAGGHAERLDVEFDQWAYGLPLTTITTVLNDFSHHGWTVVSVAEDKGLYRGHDIKDESFPTRVRYLLSRSQQ